MSAGRSAPELLRAVGLLADGPVVLGRPIRAPGPGVYLVELASPLPEAPIELTRVGKWIERVPSLRLDGERPTSRALAARLAAFWVPSSPVLYVGSTDGQVAGRVAALEHHVLGDRRPHAAAHWLKALRVDGLRVWWASTDAPEEYEDALLDAFATAVDPADVARLHRPRPLLPFANLRTTTSERKDHGITGSVRVEEAPAAVPEARVVELPPGDADGVVTEPKGTGVTRRAPRVPPPASPVTVSGGAAARSAGLRDAAPRGVASPGGASRPAATRRTARAAPGPVHLSGEGHERLKAELEELIRVRRPEVIARIRTAKELGDLRENADYTAAREEQSFLEGRIQALEARLREVVVVEAPTDSSRVVQGSRVTAEIEGESVTLTLVGSAESDPTAGRISTASPVGKALLGRVVGDEAIVRAPNGEIRYRITAID